MKAPEITEPVTPQPVDSAEPARPQKASRFAARWKLIAGVAVRLVLLLVVVRIVVMSQQEKAAEKTRGAHKPNHEFEHRDFDPSKLLKGSEATALWVRDCDANISEGVRGSGGALPGR